MKGNDYVGERNAVGKSYMAAVRGLPCVCCGVVGRTQAAHKNELKSVGKKTDARTCMALCLDCHRDYDNGGVMDKDSARQWAEQMHQQTTDALKARGEWRETWQL